MEISYIDFPYSEQNHSTKEAIEKELDRILAGEIEYMEIKNIPSSVFCEVTGCEPYDYNGWQCEWMGKFEYKGHQFKADGCAWYGTVAAMLER